jgi:hypothetical protein
LTVAEAGFRRVAGSLLFLAFATSGFAEEVPVFGLPIACELGRSCFIQNYVDSDPTSSAKDYQCGSLSYDGHNGTDFRVPSLTAQQEAVEVLAAADGRVLRRRDGMADISVREAGRPAVQAMPSSSSMAKAGKRSIATWPAAACACRLATKSRRANRSAGSAFPA